MVMVPINVHWERYADSVILVIEGPEIKMMIMAWIVGGMVFSTLI